MKDVKAFLPWDESVDIFIDGIIDLVKYKLLERDKIFVDPKFGEKYLVMQPEPPRGYLTSSEAKPLAMP